jgi:hypothetical protein
MCAGACRHLSCCSGFAQEHLAPWHSYWPPVIQRPQVTQQQQQCAWRPWVHTWGQQRQGCLWPPQHSRHGR